MKILMINLDQSQDRLQAQQKQFNALDLTFDRLPAVCVNDISKQVYYQYLTSWQRVLKQTEFACLFSHKKAWEEVLKINTPCVILEDDAVLTTDFAELLNHIEKQDFHHIDFINLEVHGRKKIVGQPLGSFSYLDYQLLPLYLDKSGTGGYIIYPSGAKKLLNYFSNGNIALADSFIYSCPDLHKYQIEPAVLLQSDKCQMYGVNFNDYQLNSLIGSIKNKIEIQLSLIQKIILKKNRVVGQITLGIKILITLIKGNKREITVKPERFYTNTK